MRQRKKASKLSLSVKLISILACVAVMSVGFASWLIVGMPETTTLADGSFEVYNVVDKTVTKSNESFENSLIKFGKPTENASTGWLIADSSTGVANLKATYTVTYSTAAGESVKINEAMSKVTVALESNATLNSAITAGYLGAPKVLVYLDDVLQNTETADQTYTYTGENLGFSYDVDMPAEASVTLKVEFVFSFGEKFGNTNPYTYFNGLEAGEKPLGSDKTNAQLAQEYLSGLFTSGINNATYTVTITPVKAQ